MSNSFKLCPTRFFRGDEKFCREVFAPLVTGLGTTLLQSKTPIPKTGRGQVKYECVVAWHASNKHCNVRTLTK